MRLSQPMIAVLVIAPALLFLMPLALQSQQPSCDCVQVTDSKGRPIRGAAIEIDQASLHRRSDNDGRFELSDIKPGTTIRVKKLGYAPATAIVFERGKPIVIVLTEAARNLETISIISSHDFPLERRLTTASIRQAPSLSDPDVFRVAVLLPGVSQPNDLKGRIHLTGGSSDETGVTLNGHPLQDPFHALGLLGAFNVGALEAATVRIHHVPAVREGGLSGVVELESRDPSTASTAELGVGILSGSLTIERPRLIAGSDVLISVRATYLDQLIKRIASRSAVGGDNLTLIGFRDGIISSRTALTANTTLTTTFFRTEDRKEFQDRTGFNGREFKWGEGLAGLELQRNPQPIGGLIRLSLNSAFARLPERSSEGDQSGQSVDLAHKRVSAVIQLTAKRDKNTVDGGLSVERLSTSQEWHAAPDDFFTSHTPRDFVGAETETVLTPFGQLRSIMSPHVRIDLGLRVPVVDGQAFMAPRFSFSFDANQLLTLSTSWDRRHQFFAEMGEPREGSGKQPLFLLSAPRVADVAAVSATVWKVGSNNTRDNQLEAVIFSKRYRNKPVIEIQSSLQSGDTSRVTKEGVRAHSYGATAALNRTIAGRHIFQASYTHQRVRDLIDGEYVPTSWDAPHQLSLFARSNLSHHWSLSTAIFAHSGAAVTPVSARVFVPSSPDDPLFSSRYIYGRPNSSRLSGYRRIDASIRRQWGKPSAERSLTLQVLNILARKNPTELDWRSYFCAKSGTCDEPRATRRGLPFIPTLTFEARW